ncbi:MAG: archaeosine synthase subunit alpha [Methanomicrobiaceae archaeon]|nr:archaeosine synthase subunit alpha [Methanomicrobiaceae archaeon]
MPLCEVKSRDGMARIGEWREGDRSISFPAVLDVEEYFPGLSANPHSSIPLSAPGSFAERYLKPYEGISLVHPEVPSSASSGDCLLLAGWHTALAYPRRYVDWLFSLKDANPPDTLWYAPAAALPSNISFLVYSGFDLFDFRGVGLASAQGRFCTPEGNFVADEWLGAGTCPCAGCREGDLQAHNRISLLSEIALVKAFILRGQLRELVERRCRADGAMVGVLRLIDEEFQHAERYAPIVRHASFLGHTAESIRRPEIRRFAERVQNRFRPSRNDVCVLLPCSARKPYSLSQSHMKLRRATGERAHEVILTSPLGVVPRELEGIYPAAHYDVPVTGYWDREESALIREMLARYLSFHPYRRIIAHLDGGALAIARTAAGDLGIDLEITCTGHPTSPASLECLSSALEGERSIPHDLVRGTLSWQFGVFPETRGLRVKGRRERRALFAGKRQLFSIDPVTGLFRPTFEGWEILGEGYRVRIDDFVPKGDVLAPGVLSCDPAVREGDEVLVEGPVARATGKAAMGAWEMGASSRGVAVRVRKVERF